MNFAKELAKRMNFPHISTGEIFRGLVKDKDPFGIELKEKYWSVGKLVKSRTAN